MDWKNGKPSLFSFLPRSFKKFLEIFDFNAPALFSGSSLAHSFYGIIKQYKGLISLLFYIICSLTSQRSINAHYVSTLL